MKNLNGRTLSRIVCLLMVVAMLLACTACGESNKGGNNDDPTDANKATNPPSSDNTDSDNTEGPTLSDINTDSIFNDDGTVTFAPGRIDIDKISTGHKTNRDILIIRVDEENGNIYNVDGGYHPQTQLMWSMTGTCLLTEGYTEGGGVDFGINKYSLCDSLEYDDDYMGVTLHIRDEAKFHNGDSVLASDVIFSCLQYKSNPRHYFIDFENFKAIDEKTVYIPLNSPNAGLTAFLGRTVRVLQEKEYRKHEEAGTLETDFYYGNDGTCGMYKIDEWVSGDYIKFSKCPYFYVPATIENVMFRYIADNTVAMMELETGGVDIVYSPAQNDIKNVLEGQYGDQISGLEDVSDMMMYLGFNMSGPLADINLRYAICHAVDWKQIVKTAWGPLGADPTTLMARTFEYQKDISDWWDGWYDPDLAKELMAKTEFANGGLELVLIINNEATKTTAAEMMGKNLEPLGITIKIESYDTATWASAMQVPEGWDLWIRDFGGTGTGWSSFFTETGFAFNTHPQIKFADSYEKMCKIGNTMLATMDPVVQKQLGYELQDMYLNGEIFYVFPMVSTKHVVLYNSELHNWSRSTNNWYIADAYFE